MSHEDDLGRILREREEFRKLLEAVSESAWIAVSGDWTIPSGLFQRINAALAKPVEDPIKWDMEAQQHYVIDKDGTKWWVS